MKKKSENQIDAEVESLFESSIIGDKEVYETAIKLNREKGGQARYDKRFENIGLFAVANPVKYLPRYEKEESEVVLSSRHKGIKSVHAMPLPE